MLFERGLYWFLSRVINLTLQINSKFIKKIQFIALKSSKIFNWVRLYNQTHPKFKKLLTHLKLKQGSRQN